MPPIWEPQLSAPWPPGAVALLWLYCDFGCAEVADPTPRSLTLRPFRRAGKTIAENLAECAPLVEGQKIVSTFEKPVKPTGHIAILQVSAQVRG